VFIVGGIVGSAAFGVWVELKKTYKLSVIIISVLSVASTVATAFAFTSGSSGLVTASCFVIGFSMIPIMAVGFELGVEVTYPIDESYSTGLLMFAGQFLGIVYVSNCNIDIYKTLISSILITKQGQHGCVVSQLIFVGSLFVSVVLSFFVKEDLRRQKQEKINKH
jgi:FLVCR family feline leukemia virus subgroup C receptor-related protein